MLTDTHIHLYNKEFDPDREQCIEQAVSAGVGRFFLPNIDLEAFGQSFYYEQAVFKARAHTVFMRAKWSF